MGEQEGNMTIKIVEIEKQRKMNMADELIVALWNTFQSKNKEPDIIWY
jgi:hypothetical protein